MTATDEREEWPRLSTVGIGMRLLFWGKPGHAYHPMMRSFVLLVPVLFEEAALNFYAHRTVGD